MVIGGCREPAPAKVQLPPHLENRPEMYSADAIHAQVVDAATGTPVNGAVVVVLWRKIAIHVETWEGTFRLSEVVTGPDGRFHTPRWGPRPGGYDFFLDARDPEIWVLKRGYLTGYFDNEAAADARAFSGSAPASVRLSKPAPHEIRGRIKSRYVRAANAASIWNGRTLPLHRAPNAEQQARALASAAPIDAFDPAPPALPLFWREWESARDALGPQWRARIEQPTPQRAEATRSTTSLTLVGGSV